MASEKSNARLRLGVLITSPKKADKAAKICIDKKIPVLYRISAVGTAPNEMTDILGLGSPDKAIMITALSAFDSEQLMLTYKKQLRLGTIDSGIAFTIPIGSASVLLLHIANKIQGTNNNGKEEKPMASTHSLIVATVDHGFSQEAMDAARTAGAGGGTVIHGHRVGNEQEASLWGLSFQEAKDIVLIVADNDSKNSIMTAISEKCGMKSEAKGMVISLPIDTVTGIN
jgi:hypothetical protein